MNLAPPLGTGTLPAPLNQPTIVPPSIATISPAAPPPGAAAPNQGVLSLTARYGKDLPVINGGLVWRVFADKPDDTGTFKLIREERGATPNIVLPPGNYVVHDVPAMGHAVRREGRTGDDQAVGAHDPEEPHSKLVGARPVVAVQEKDLQHRIVELHRLKPPAKPHDVARVQWARRPRVSLTCIDRYKPHVNQAPENPFRRNEGVLGAHALMG